MLIVLWSTRNIKSLFPLKDKVVHQIYEETWVIYEGKCSCGLSYIGETKRNSEVRWKEHEDPAGKSEPAKHLIENTYHQFTWKVLSVTPSYFRRRKIQEAFFIALRKPASNDQLEHHFFLCFVMVLPKYYLLQFWYIPSFFCSYYVILRFIHCFSFVSMCLHFPFYFIVLLVSLKKQQFR